MKRKTTDELTEDQRTIASLKRSISTLQDELIKAHSQNLSAQTQLADVTRRINSDSAYLVSVICEWSNGQRYSLSVPYKP